MAENRKHQPPRKICQHAVAGPDRSGSCRLPPPQTGDTKRIAIMWEWSMKQKTHF